MIEPRKLVAEQIHEAIIYKSQKMNLVRLAEEWRPTTIFLGRELYAQLVKESPRLFSDVKMDRIFGLSVRRLDRYPRILEIE